MLPKEWLIKICAGKLNSFEQLRMTDCSFTFDHHIRQEQIVENSLNCIENSKDLFELYFLLNQNGMHNITRYFSKVFTKIETIHNQTPSLSIWDFRNTKKLYYN